MRTMSNLLILVAAMLLSLPAIAQDAREERVSFQPGRSGADIRGSIRGYEIVDYLIDARAGQTIEISLKTSNLSSYFNLLQGSDPTAIYVGSTEGNDYTGVLPDDADYRIRVYLMRNAARRDETADYTLSVAITGGKATSPSPDYADGLAGGPDFWQVRGVPAGDTLNVRSGAGTSNRVVGALANGDRVRNLGCEMAGTARWCRIEAASGQALTGWVSGRYLVEAGAEPNNGINSQATGQIPCSPLAGQPTTNCAFRVTRGGNGNAAVWIELPAGGERYIEFVDGRPEITDAGMQISFEKISDLYLIRIDGSERYEIPEAVVYGG